MDQQTLNEFFEQELVRERIRQELAQRDPHTGNQRLLVFLNSGFGLWFLSSVLVGLTTLSFAQITKRNAIERERADQVRKLDVELPYRLEALQTDAPDRQTLTTMCIAPSIASNFSTPLPNTQTFELARFVYPEFKDRNLFPLFWELENLLPEADRTEVREARMTLESVRKELRALDDGKIAQELVPRLERLWLSRWRR